ncbi:unnamed protein product [Discula destructiva]
MRFAAIFGFLSLAAAAALPADSEGVYPGAALESREGGIGTGDIYSWPSTGNKITASYFPDVGLTMDSVDETYVEITCYNNSARNAEFSLIDDATKALLYQSRAYAGTECTPVSFPRNQAKVQVVIKLGYF